jgi:hypothetical protein
VIAELLKPILTQTRLKTTLDEHINHLPDDSEESPKTTNSREVEEVEEPNTRANLMSAPLSVNGDIPFELDQKSQHLPMISRDLSQESEILEQNLDDPNNGRLLTIPTVTTNEYLPSVLEMSPYDGLVSKLHHQQKIVVRNEINPSGPSETVTLLGPKSLNDEGRILTIRQRVREDEAAQQRYAEEHPVVYDPSTSEYFFTMDHCVTRQERKKMLLSYIQERKGLDMM